MAETTRGETVNIEQYIRNANFPCDRQELERTARQNDAPREVMDRIRQLPSQRFQNVQEVKQHVGGGGGSGGTGGGKGGGTGGGAGGGGPGYGGGQSSSQKEGNIGRESSRRK